MADISRFSKNPKVGRGFDTALPAEKEAEYTRRTSPLGKYSPRAAILSGVSKIIDAFSDDETATGRRHARNAAKKMKIHGKNPKEGGGMIRDRRDGMAMGGRTRLPRVDDTKILMEAGGYSGGLAETGRGTMAGELGKKGSMSVREAGEDMYELSKRKRRMQGGGAASSYNRRNNNQNK
jgi:hypothetical protein